MVELSLPRTVTATTKVVDFVMTHQIPMSHKTATARDFVKMVTFKIGGLLLFGVTKLEEDWLVLNLYVREYKHLTVEHALISKVLIFNVGPVWDGRVIMRFECSTQETLITIIVIMMQIHTPCVKNNSNFATFKTFFL